MIEIIGIRFRNAGKIYYFAPNGVTALPGQKVIVQTVRGIEIGTVVLGNKEIDESQNIKDLSPVLRLATEEDLKQDNENRKKEKKAFDICVDKIKQHGLDMKLINVEYTFDCSKIVFCFTADGRVDFRELVKDLAGVFKTRIELRQIGVRDQTKSVAGLGLCGRQVCCAAFLTDFDQITVKMAKDQGLSSSPQKISGPCGKLICCLSFEQKAYEEDYKELPRMGAYVKTPGGCGTVCEVNALKQGVRVRLEDKPNESPVFYKKEELSIPNPEEEKPQQTAQETEKPTQTEGQTEQEQPQKPKKKKKHFYNKNKKPQQKKENGTQNKQ